MQNLKFDVFCQVIDNFGDVGVCWRLCVQLAALGHRVNLWLDDASALTWMAPKGCQGVAVRAWADAANAPPTDTLIEAFGCRANPDFIATNALNALAKTENEAEKSFVWLNLEYLSAERFVVRYHALASPVLNGPGAGCVSHFFYPGFTPGTGGLMREPDLAARRAAFCRDTWLQSLGQAPATFDERLVSLFCYEPAPLAAWLVALSEGRAWAEPGMRTRLLVCPGRAAQAVEAALEILNKNGRLPANSLGSLLSIFYLPNLSQTDFDHLLWACDLNCVRGEDSVVRALWAGQALLWHIYPQDDGAHGPKLAAFLAEMGADAAQIEAHRCWNNLQNGDLPPIDLSAWRRSTHGFQVRLEAQTPLVEQLLAFVSQQRGRQKAQ